MNKTTKNWINGTLLGLLVLAIISIALNFFIDLIMIESLRVVFGSVYILFLPGFIISFIFFPKSKPFEESKLKEIETSKNLGSLGIDWIERIALSFALSIAIVPLAVFYLNLIGVRINLLNSFLTILGIIVISSGILYWRIKKLKNFYF